MCLTYAVLCILFGIYPRLDAGNGCPKTLRAKKHGVQFTATVTDDDGKSEKKTVENLQELTDVTGVTVTVTCSNTWETFNNELKLVPGISAYSIYSTGGFTMKCTDKGTWSPNIYYRHTSDGTKTSERMKYMCAGGCPLLQDKTHVFVYADGMISKEKYSPPVLPSRDVSPLYVDVQCKRGYTRAVGDTKATRTFCSTSKQWSPSSGFTQCVKGCNDTTKSVTWGWTQAQASTIVGGPPFIAGDVIKFNCETGFSIVGNSSITCKGDNTWDSSPPTCVVSS